MPPIDGLEDKWSGFVGFLWDCRSGLPTVEPFCRWRASMDSFNRRDFLGTALGLAGSLALVGCGGNGNFVPPTKSDTAAVAAWNEIATDTVQKFKESDPGGGLPPYVEARPYARAFVAAPRRLN